MTGSGKYIGGGAGMARHQWLLIVAIVAGLIGMHHLVQAPPVHMTSLTMASATHTEHADRDRAGLKPVEVRSMSTSVAASQPDCCDSMDIAGHCCLAVLTAAIAALAAALIMAAAQRRPLEPGYRLAAVSAVAARPPPIGSARLAQLCVLRR
jgi:hypothetical protein